MSLSLPADRPNLEQLRKQAKDLLKAHKRGDASTCRVLRHLSRFAAATDKEILKAVLSLSEAQHALAFEYGFKNWAALARCVKGSPLHRKEDSLRRVTVENVEKGGALHMMMGRVEKCESCDEPATVHVTNRSGGRMVAQHYCAKHAPAENVNVGVGRAEKCESCDEPGTVHVTNRSGGRMVTQHYCAKHAAENVKVPGLPGLAVAHVFPYPLKYAVTVTLTQYHLDRQEAVPVTLPDGSAFQACFRREYTGEIEACVTLPDGSVLFRTRFPRQRGDPYRVVLKFPWSKPGNPEKYGIKLSVDFT